MKTSEIKNKTIPAEELDAMFDNGEDISAYVDHSSITFPNRQKTGSAIRKSESRPTHTAPAG
jgi:hypothetical protein